MQKLSRANKRHLISTTIYDTAIDLFATEGFDTTTVDDIAEAAGVSRRSFFRYFESKDDLLARSVVRYGNALVEGVNACKRGTTPLEALHRTVEAGMQYSDAQPRLRQVIEIARSHPSARQAYLSRMMEVEDALASAFADYLERSENDMEPRLLAGITLAVMNATVLAWFNEAGKDPSACARKVFKTLDRYFREK